MGIMCKLGLHRWKGCKCAVCHQARFPDARERLDWLKSKMGDTADQSFSISQELHDIAERYPNLAEDAVLALARCFAQFEGATYLWDKTAADLLVALGPKARAASRYLERIMALPMPPGYDPNERIMNATPAQTLGSLIKAAQDDSRRILEAIGA